MDCTYYFPPTPSSAPELIAADVCVYGATPGGVTAAIQASRLGKKAVLIELGRHVGGMTAGGLSDTDGGDPSITGGIAAEFYARLKRRSGFRPSAAEEAFRGMLEESTAWPFYFEHPLQSVSKEGNRIVELLLEGGRSGPSQRPFIDATYEGDLMARSGRLLCHRRREGNARYGEEDERGVIFGPKDNFDQPVDPYVRRGDPESGLLSGITGDPAGLRSARRPRGSQAYNFRMWLVPAERGLPWPKPANYEPARYELLLRYIEAGNHHIAIHAGDNNNHHFFNGAFSTDDIGMNYAWPEADYPTRERIFQEHVSYQQGLMYFLANNVRVPAEIREKIRRFGLPADDFTDTEGAGPFQLYVRRGAPHESATT